PPHHLGTPSPTPPSTLSPYTTLFRSGPTGSGKSTTLAAIIDLINETKALHVITIEDPIEFVHQNKKCLIHQREIGAHATSFAEADRKSTRLNSSHSQISYAVFCLKKK